MSNSNNVRLYFYTYVWEEGYDSNGKPIVQKVNTTYYIDGYVEKNEPTIWSKEEGCSIDIVCFDPYFKNKKPEEISFSDIIPKFHYPWIDSDEDVNQTEETQEAYGTDVPLFIMSEKVKEHVKELNEAKILKNENKEKVLE